MPLQVVSIPANSNSLRVLLMWLSFPQSVRPTNNESDPSVSCDATLANFFSKKRFYIGDRPAKNLLIGDSSFEEIMNPLSE